MGGNRLLEVLAMVATLSVASYLFYKEYYNRLKGKDEESLSDFQKKVVKFHEKAAEKRDLWLGDYVIEPVHGLAGKCLKGYEKSELLHNLAGKFHKRYGNLGRRISSLRAYKRMEQLKEKAEPYAEKIVGSIDDFIKF